jgi:hypothetical protein
VEKHLGITIIRLYYCHNPVLPANLCLTFSIALHLLNELVDDTIASSTITTEPNGGAIRFAVPRRSRADATRGGEEDFADICQQLCCGRPAPSTHLYRGRRDAWFDAARNAGEARSASVVASC